MNYAFMDMFINTMQFFFGIMDTHMSKATGISLQFGYIYGHYAHKYTWAQLSMNDLYSELSHII